MRSYPTLDPDRAPDRKCLFERRANRCLVDYITKALGCESRVDPAGLPG